MPEQDTKKAEWLKEYPHTVSEIRRLETELEEWQRLSRRHTPCGAAGAKLQQVKALLDNKLVEAVEKRLLLDEAIQTVHDPVHREVLVCRYIQRMNWSQVSERLHYSQQHLQRLHVAALDALEIPQTAGRAA